MQSKFEYRAIEICGTCKGTGQVEDERLFRKTLLECPVCEGSGRVVKTRKGTVTVEPYKGQPV